MNADCFCEFAMIPAVQQKQPQLAPLCRKYGVRRLELFGSAATESSHTRSRRCRRGKSPVVAACCELSTASENSRPSLRLNSASRSWAS
jgi:hypothetical protein